MVKNSVMQIYEVSELIYNFKGRRYVETNQRCWRGRSELCRQENLKYNGTVDYQFNRKKNLQCDLEKDGKLLRIRKILNGI